MKSARTSIAIIFLVGASYLQGTTLVYNLPIRRAFGGLILFVKPKKKFSWAFSSVPIFYRRTARVISPRLGTDVCDKRIGGGSIFNLRYIPSRSWWFEATTAVQKESVTATGTSNFKASRTAFDDVVLAGGYNVFPSKESQVTVYGLAGFPTRRKVTLEEAQDRLVGTRFFAIGGGAEFSYSFLLTPKQTLAGILQARVIHFFSREWQTILGPDGRIQPGQGTDILMALRYRYKRTVFETGYNPTIFTNQALILPNETIKTDTQVRHGGYFSIIHLSRHVRLRDKPVAFGAGILFNRLKALDLTTVSAYLNVTIIF